MGGRGRRRGEATPERRALGDRLLGAGLAVCLFAFNFLFAAACASAATTVGMALAMVALYPVLLVAEVYVVRRRLTLPPPYRAALTWGAAASLLVLAPFAYALLRAAAR